jgi:dTDP-4-dehydrorhamnose reductase
MAAARPKAKNNSVEPASATSLCAPPGCSACTAPILSKPCCGWPANDRTLRVVDDQIGCPTYAADLAGALLDIAAHAGRQCGRVGNLSFLQSGAGHLVCLHPAHHRPGARLRILDGQRNHSHYNRQYPLPAPRPPYSVLDCGSLERCFGITRRPWEAALQEMLTQLYRQAQE